MNKTILHISLSENCRNFLAQAGIQAYHYSSEILENSPLLLTRRGRSLYPHLVNAVYDLNVKGLCDKEEIPFFAEEESNGRKNSYYMIFRGKGLEFTISRISPKDSFPRYSDFRNNYSQNNDLISLFPEYEKPLSDDMAYAILTHGGNFNKMSFSQIGLPRIGTQSWVFNPLVLSDRARIVEVKSEPAKDIKIEKPKLKIVEDMLGEKLK